MDNGYDIKMEDRGEYLHVVVGGPKLTAGIARGYWNEISERCFELGISKILIEKEFEESVTPGEMLEMAEHVGRILATRKIAFIDRYGHESINELGKKLARNRDVMLQLFVNIESAEKWLLAN